MCRAARLRSRAAAAACALVASGCAAGEEASVQQAALRFGAALEAGDPATACGLLEPATRAELERNEQSPCPQALAAAGLPLVPDLGRVQRFGRLGQVELTGPDGARDTRFLARHGSTWLVSAAGCRPQGDLPYACDVEGP